LPKQKRLGFFTRLLDDATPAERYRLAAEQIIHAERHGFDTAWVAQHHFSHAEGGLPAPFVFLANLAARTSRIRLGTGIVTLPLEQPVRAAEDAAVLDLLSGGRLELGLGSGGTASSFAAFGHVSAQRGAIFERHLETFRNALAGAPLAGEQHLYPPAHDLLERMWQATFSANGAARAGKSADGLMLSRTQPRSSDAPFATLAEVQNPIVDAYLAALPREIAPRIVASRTLFVADDRDEALRYAETGLRRVADHMKAAGHRIPGNTLADLIKGLDTHVGTPEDVIHSLSADSVLDRVSDVVFQVHSVDPPHPRILRSIELIATKVAPALGWTTPEANKPRLAAAR
jgi:putative FMN-dependent luciferase-like monooxygenase